MSAISETDLFATAADALPEEICSEAGSVGSAQSVVINSVDVDWMGLVIAFFEYIDAEQYVHDVEKNWTQNPQFLDVNQEAFCTFLAEALSVDVKTESSELVDSWSILFKDVLPKKEELWLSGAIYYNSNGVPKDPLSLGDVRYELELRKHTEKANWDLIFQNGFSETIDVETGQVQAIGETADYIQEEEFHPVSYREANPKTSGTILFKPMPIDANYQAIVRAQHEFLLKSLERKLESLTDLEFHHFYKITRIDSPDQAVFIQRAMPLLEMRRMKLEKYLDQKETVFCLGKFFKLENWDLRPTNVKGLTISPWEMQNHNVTLVNLCGVMKGLPNLCSASFFTGVTYDIGDFVVFADLIKQSGLEYFSIEFGLNVGRVDDKFLKCLQKFADAIRENETLKRVEIKFKLTFDNPAFAAMRDNVAAVLIGILKDNQTLEKITLPGICADFTSPVVEAAYCALYEDNTTSRVEEISFFEWSTLYTGNFKEFAMFKKPGEKVQVEWSNGGCRVIGTGVV